MLQYVLGNAFLFFLLCVMFWLPGAVLVAWFKPTLNAAGFRRLAEICLGLTVWTIGLFALATIRQLHLVAVVSFAAVWLMAGLACRSRRTASRPPLLNPPQPPANKLLTVGLPALVVVPCFIVALGPELAWDASAYHLTLPKLYLAHGGFRPVEMNIYSNWPLNVELLFAAAMLIKDYTLATTLHCGFGMLTLYAIYSLCRSSPHPRSALLGVMLFLTNVIVVWEMTVAYVDLACAFFLVAGFAFMIAARADAPNRRFHLLMCGLCCGLLAGTEVTGFLGGLVLAAVLLPDIWSARAGTRGAELKTLLVWFLLPAALLALPWVVKAAWYTGNPVYPFLHHWLGGPDWSDTLAGQFASWHKNVGMGRSFTDYLLLPFRVILCGKMGGKNFDRFDGHIWSAWIAVIPLTLLLGMRLSLVRRCMAVCGLYFLLWALSSQQIRFLIPVLPPLSVAAAVALYEDIDRIQVHRWRRALPPACLALCTAAGLGVNLGNDVLGARFLRALRRDGTEATRASAVEPVMAFANHQLPPDARLLMLNTDQAFFLDRDYLADSCCEASQITDWLRSAADRHEVRKRLAERGITHVLSMKNELGTAYPQTLWDLLADPSQAHAIYKSTDGRYELWSLTPTPQG